MRDFTIMQLENIRASTHLMKPDLGRAGVLVVLAQLWVGVGCSGEIQHEYKNNGLLLNYLQNKQRETYVARCSGVSAMLILR